MSSSALAAGIRQLRRQLAVQANDNSDEQLLHVFTSRHDDAAFATLVRRHGPMVLRVCHRVLGHEQDAEDAFQAAFLVLARNAAALRNKTSLASWLHGIAYRTAMKAKQSAARRRKHEKQTPARRAVNPADELLWREVRELLDEEIARLPDSYRSVFVLCCLEELSQAETGRRLGLKERTVSNRLAEARKRLSRRLSRHGVELSAVLAASTLPAQSASALPAGLMATTVQAALAMAAGEDLAGMVSASVAELIQSMMASKTKIATILLLTVTLLGGAGLGWSSGFQFPSGGRQPPESGATRGANAPRSDSTKHEAAKTVEIQGRVLGPEGKPKEGAKLLLLDKGDKPRPLGTTTADGRFTISVPKNARDSYLVAQAEDGGIDFVDVPKIDPKKPAELRLVKDRPIHGQVLNTEGRPVPGVRVAVKNLGVYANNSLDSFLAVWKKQQKVTGGLPNGEKHIWRGAGALLAATTDAEGRFTIPQVGDERLASLRLSGGGIADADVLVVNRDGFDPKPYNEAVIHNSAPREIKFFGVHWHLYGPRASIVVETGKTIRGIVKDADSGMGRPGVRVRLTRQNNHDLVWTVPETITDAQGRYEIRGARKAQRYMLEIASDPLAGYMPCQVWAEDTFGYEPVTADIRVKKGVIITGKVIDQATGKSVPGWAMTDILSDNPFVKEYPQFGSSASAAGVERTGEDGTFRVVAIPGPILLMGGRGPDSDFYRPGGNIETMQYKPASADANYPQYFRRSPNNPAFYSFRGAVPLSGNSCKVLEIKPGAATVNQDIVLERASALAMKLQDGRGQPLANVWTTGITPENWHHPVLIECDTCSAYGVEKAKHRLMIFYQPVRKLIAAQTLKDDEKQPVAVKLGPSGAIVGRLFDADGNPLAGAVVDVRYRDREAEEMDRVIHEGKQVVTDARGAFTIGELVPEMKFELSFRRGRQRFQRETKDGEAMIQVRAGECRDLGDIRAKR